MELLTGNKKQVFSFILSMKKPKKAPKDIETSVYLKCLGNRLKELRIKNGYTNYEYFAFENGLGRSQYGKYEKGGNIQFDTLINIIKIHGMTVKEFFSEGFD